MTDFDLSSFLASFFDEAKGRLASIDKKLVKFERGDLNEEEMIALRRDAHTIKGSALMLGVQDVGEVAHLFEDAMEHLIEHPDARSPVMIQFLFDLHDRLKERVEDPEDSTPLEVRPLRQEFESLLKQDKHDSDVSKKIDRDSSTETMDESFTNIPEIELDLDEEKSKQIEKPESLVIGAEEARQWRDEKLRKQPPTEAETPIDEAYAAEEQRRARAPRVLDAIQTEDFKGYRPELAHVEIGRGGYRQSSGRFLRVDAARVENLSNQMVELSLEKSKMQIFEREFRDLLNGLRKIARNWRSFQTAELPPEERKQLGLQIGEALDGHLRKAHVYFEKLRHDQIHRSMLFDELRDQVLGLMLRPLDNIFSSFPRAVRDMAVRSGKQVRLLVGGESVEMDQTVTEALVEPLVHLLNNAVTHGIEPPEARRAAGKPEEGQVTVLARQMGAEISIEVIDDGAGIDVENIRQVAVERGVTTQAEADAMNQAEVLELIFRPGFSTHHEIDNLAGRGIGMNVVQDTVRKLTGSIRIQTEAGKGTRFILTLPVSIAVQRALMFRIGSQHFGMLAHMVNQVLPLRESEIQVDKGGRKSILFDEQQIPLVELQSVLGKDSRADNTSKPIVIVAEHIEGYVGIVVDELYDEQEIIVRDLDPYLKRYQTQGLMGYTVAGDGKVLLLIEPYGIKEMGRTAPGQQLKKLKEGIAAVDTGFNLLLVEDSIIARELEKSVFASIGFAVDTAIDGMDALEKMRLHEYDILVTDLEMPRLDGFGLVRQLRNERKYEDLPILIISTRESAQDRMRALEAGADAYLVKQQLNPEELKKTLESLLGPLTPVTESNTNRVS